MQTSNISSDGSGLVVANEWLLKSGLVARTSTFLGTYWRVMVFNLKADYKVWLLSSVNTQNCLWTLCKSLQDVRLLFWQIQVLALLCWPSCSLFYPVAYSPPIQSWKCKLCLLGGNKNLALAAHTWTVVQVSWVDAWASTWYIASLLTTYIECDQIVNVCRLSLA